MIKDTISAKWITFKLEEKVYSLDVMQVQEVLSYVEITPIPGAIDYILGVINLRGNIISILDMKKFFKLSINNARITNKTRIIILEFEKKLIGILVDSILKIMPSEIKFIESKSKDSEYVCKFLQGICEIDDQLYHLIDLSKLFIEELPDINESIGT